jgi:hypothetical protein
MKQWWLDYPWRMIQTNFRQTDMENIDAVEYAKHLKAFNATVVAINTGGIMASYETDLDDHPVSPFLHGDSLRKIFDECHKAGIRVLARMDFSKVAKEVFMKHPEWAYKSARGEYMEYNGYYQMCFSGEFQQKIAFEITREVMEKFPIDGFYLNMGGYKTTDYSYKNYGLCHCDNCKKEFKSMFGCDLDEGNSGMLKLFQERMYSQTIDRLNSMIKSINPQVALNGVDYQRIEAKTEFLSMGAEWMYNASSIARGGTVRGVPRVSTSSVDFIGFYLRHNSVGSELQSLRFWQCIANNGMPDYFIMGRFDNHEDRTGFPAVRKAFSYMAENEDLYRNLETWADVLVIREQPYVISAENKGWIRVLTENHILFSEIESKFITDRTDLSRFKVIVLADYQRVSDELVDKIDRFVEKGGKLIVTGRSGLIDGEFKARKAMPFKCLGVDGQTSIVDGQISSMLKIKEDDRVLVPSIGDTDILYVGDRFVSGCWSEGVEKHLAFIPPHPFGPPEICYYTEISDHPGFTVNRYGEGLGICICWPVGERFYQDGYPSSGLFMKDILETVAGIKPLDCGNLSEMVEVSVCEELNGKHVILHLVNTSGCLGQSYVKPLEIRDITVKIAVRNPVKEVRSLYGSNVSFAYEKGVVEIKLDRLEDFAAILIK